MLIDDINGIAAGIGATVTDKKGVSKITAVIAERKAFLSKVKLEYIARFRIDEAAKELRFTEVLKEAGSGLSSSGGDDMSPGFGFKTETYKTGPGPREGSIKEQSDLFGKKFEYRFDYSTIRQQIEARATAAGYLFRYLVTPVGL